MDTNGISCPMAANPQNTNSNPVELGGATPGERLRTARLRKGYSTVVSASKAMGANYSAYTHHENGTRNFKLNDAKRYGRFYGVTASWLLTGEDQPGVTTGVPIVGYVGAGALVYPTDDHEVGDGIDEAPAPSDATGAEVAVIVRGDSMYPAYRDGDIIYYDQHGTDLAQCLGRECVVKLADDRVLVKTVERGSAEGLVTLESYNAPSERDVEVVWIAPIVWVRKANAPIK